MNLGKETETLEFEKTTGEMKEAMISISSILNKHGIGTLYFGVKGNYESVIRNATTAKILYLNKSIEQFGSGFKRINSLCKDAGIRFSYESDELGFKFTLYRPQRQSDIPSVTLDVTLNGTEMAVLAILKQKPDSSRGEIADKISKTVRTVQRALNSLRDKGYIQRVGSKQEPRWEVLK